MKYREGKIVVSILIVMVIFMLLDITHSSYGEDKGAPQLEVPDLEQTNDLEGSECCHDDNRIDMNSIAGDVDLVKSVQEEDVPKEAAIDQEKLYFINGTDSFAYRGWPAFDSTALVDEKTDTLILAGENGILYTIKLNTDYNGTENTITIDPKVTKYRYKITGNHYQGIENSVAVYKNLAYFADNGGTLATPAMGKNSLEQLIIFNLARWGGFNKGLLIALDKSSGEEVWRLGLTNYSWSSPVDVYTENGDGYIILCDSAGRMYLIDGLTGTVLDSISLGAN